MATRRRLSGSAPSHAQVLRRLQDLEQAADLGKDQVEAELLQLTVWRALPLVIRCLFNADQWNRSDIGYHWLSPRLSAAVCDALNGHDVMLASAAGVLKDAAMWLEGKLLRAHGCNTWSYIVPERQEAAQLLFAADVDEVDALSGEALVALWHARGSRSEDLLTVEGLAVLRAATGETSRDVCAHAEDEHPVPLRHARIALEAEVFRLFGVPAIGNRSLG